MRRPSRCSSLPTHSAPFGALGGRMFADEFEFQSELVPETRRYYANIVGKYGDQVQTALGKLESLPIRMICPLHGPVWRKKLADILNLYQKWSTYTPEVQGVLVAYASVYGNTEQVAQQLAGRFSEAGQKVALYDVSAVHPSYLVAEAFRYSHLVLASTTYNAGIFVNMEQFLRQLVHHNLQNRTVALVENGSWAPESGRLMRSLLSECKNMTVLPADGAAVFGPAAGPGRPGGGAVRGGAGDHETRAEGGAPWRGHRDGGAFQIKLWIVCIDRAGKWER